MTLLKAVEAGVDVVDTALSALGNGTSQPTTESMVATLQGTEHDTGLDLKAADRAGRLLPRRGGRADQGRLARSCPRACPPTQTP